MAYPSAVDKFNANEYPTALKAVGLDQLLGKLEMHKRWDKKLSEDEQHALAFARVRLQKPDWLLIDEALDSVEPATHQRVVEMLSKELKHMGIVHIGKSEAHDHIFKRVLHLMKDPATHTLERKPMPDIKPKARTAEPVR
jgi:putative ATP-binding cassette transporter